MNVLPALEFSWMQTLAWTLVHFIWEGALIGLAAYTLLRAARLSPAWRYGVGVAALALMLAVPIVTFAVLQQAGGNYPVVSRTAQYSGAPDSSSSQDEGSIASSHRVSPPGPQASGLRNFRMFAPPAIAIVWLAGVFVLSVRLLGGWVVARRLVKRAVGPVVSETRALAERVAARLTLRRAARFLESSAISFPVTIGWLKPVVLLPASALTGLSAAQIEALVAHELAHIWRQDYLVNLMQSAVETLLFYHPAVWWASGVVRDEREHCCDDVALRICDRLVYVTALSDLAAIKMPPRTAMAASGGSLLERVRRILGGARCVERERCAWLPVFVMIFLAGLLMPMVLRSTPVSEQGRQNAGLQPGVASRSLAGIAGGVEGAVIEGELIATRRMPANQGVPSENAQKQDQTVPPAGIERQNSTTLQAQQANADEAAQKKQALDSAAAAKRASEIAKLESDLKQAQERYQRAKQLAEAGLTTTQNLAEVEIQLRSIEQKLVALRQTGQSSEQVKVMVDLSAQLELARLRLERAQRLFDFHLTGTQAVKEAEDAVAASESKLAAAREALQNSETDLRLNHSEREAEIARIERATRDIGTKAQEEARRTAELRVKQAADAAIAADTDALVRAAVTAEFDQRLLASSAPVADLNSTARAGDILVIEIEHEPDLPRNYVVANDGTIRLPLIGNVKVAGLTTAQVREGVLHELNRRDLAGNRGVTVTLRRPR